VASLPSNADEESVTLRSTLHAVSRLRRRLIDQRGYTLTELLTAMSILTIVIATLGSVMVSGTNTENDLSDRFRAEQSARLALGRFRREVHNACDKSLSGVSGSGYTTVTLSSEASTPPYTCSASGTWCVVGTAAPYSLYRKPGATCDNAGVKWAGNLTTNAVFTEVAASGGKLPRLGILLSVDVRPADPAQRYRLFDSIAVRNYLRS
jgi:prepilin-type N-terminal cleavage/methylation domain-containing protein